MTLIEQVASEYERMKQLEDKLTDSIGRAVRKCVADELNMGFRERHCIDNGIDPNMDYEWRYWHERHVASLAALRALVSLEMDDESATADYIGELLDDERASLR